MNKTSKMLPVLLAAAVVIILAGSLGARLISRERAQPHLPTPVSSVPAPAALEVSDLDIPCWSCPSSKDWPLRFQTDLDFLAPLGTGQANAAEFFGFLGVAGKVSAVFGPLLFGLVSVQTGSQRWAVAVVGLFFLVGLGVLFTVDEARGIESARRAVE